MIPIPFLITANVILGARFFCFFRDSPVRGRGWAKKSVFELAALIACFESGASLVGACVTVLVANVAGNAVEGDGSRRNFRRLLVGLLELVALGFCFSPAADPQFRGFWIDIGQFASEWTSFGNLFRALAGAGAQTILFGLLLSANEANLAIRAVFDRLDLKPRLPTQGSNLVDAGELSRGRVIGLLERALLYVFILLGQFGAIGFVLAAKAFARSKALDDRAFAEYVLIGTLLSGGLALCIGLAIRNLWLM